MERFKKQKGAIAVMTAILLPVLLTFTGIAIDVGRLYVEKAKLQNLADAAAISAMVELKNKYKTEGYKEGSGKITPTIPIGAVVNNSKPEIQIIGDRGANYYLTKNVKLGEFQTTGAGVESNIYALRADDGLEETDDLDAPAYEIPPTYRYYYEIIVGKEFPVYFARFVHPDDILVRAGAVCCIDIQEPHDIINYAYALANWSTMSLEELANINPTKRLKVDREALRNLANYFAGKDKDFLYEQLGIYGGQNILLGHYQEGLDGNGEVTFNYNPNNNSAAGKNAGDKVLNWLQGDYNLEKEINHNQRYLFSKYATENQDGIKVYFTINNSGKITKVDVKINPASANQGSGPLAVSVTAPSTTN